MLKKFLCVCGILLFAPSVFAATMCVRAVTPFSTEKPTDTMTVKLLEEYQLSDTVTLPIGTVINGTVSDVVSPKRLKRDATFSFTAQKYNDGHGLSGDFDKNYTGRYYQKIDKKELAKNTSLTVGSFFVKGLSLGVNAVQGAIKNEEGNRFKSSAKSVYDNSPLSYVEEGQELDIKPNDIFWIKFKNSSEDEPNYEYYPNQAN